MSNIVPFSSAALPAYMRNKTANVALNKDVASGAQYPSLSIKGKVWTITQDNERQVITREIDGEQELQPKLSLVTIRANKNARVLYLKKFVEGDDMGRPDCQSMDGVAPTADSVAPQSPKCAICPHAVWGTGYEGNGTKCSVVTRAVVADPENLKPMLLRIPAGSRKNFSDAVKAGDKRGIVYNAMVLQLSFEPEAASPKILFKPIGLVTDEAKAQIDELYDSEMVRDMLGLDAATIADRPALAAPVQVDELDAAIAARAAVTAAKVKPAPAPEPVEDGDDGFGGFDAPAPAAAPVAVKAKPAPAAVVPVKVKPAAPVAVVADAGVADLMSALDGLLDQPDD